MLWKISLWCNFVVPCCQDPVTATAHRATQPLALNPLFRCHGNCSQWSKWHVATSRTLAGSPWRWVEIEISRDAHRAEIIYDPLVAHSALSPPGLARYVLIMWAAMGAKVGLTPLSPEHIYRYCASDVLSCCDAANVYFISVKKPVVLTIMWSSVKFSLSYPCWPTVTIR